MKNEYYLKGDEHAHIATIKIYQLYLHIIQPEHITL